jgi:translocator protein
MASTIKAAPVQKWLALGVLLALVLIVGAAGSVVTMPKIPAWYAGLNKPFFSPPNWVFGPVWTLLYIMMAVAAWRVWLVRKLEQRNQALMLFAIQLALNAFWSPAFFGFEAPRAALVVIAALLLAIALTTLRFFALDRIAGWLFVPYLCWVAFATALNGAIVMLN